MADTGAPHNLPYPVGTDAPYVHLDIKALAEAVATPLAAMVGNGRGDVARATTTLVLTTTPTQPVGMLATIDAPRAGMRAVVTAFLDCRNTGSGTITGALHVDGSGTAETGQIITQSVTRVTNGQTWLVPLAAAGVHTFAIKVSATAPAAGVEVSNQHSGLTVILLDSVAA